MVERGKAGGGMGGEGGAGVGGRTEGEGLRKGGRAQVRRVGVISRGGGDVCSGLEREKGSGGWRCWSEVSDYYLCCIEYILFIQIVRSSPLQRRELDARIAQYSGCFFSAVYSRV